MKYFHLPTDSCRYIITASERKNRYADRCKRDCGKFIETVLKVDESKR